MPEKNSTEIESNVIFKSGELKEEVVCAKFAPTTQHGAIVGKTQAAVSNFYAVVDILTNNPTRNIN